MGYFDWLNLDHMSQPCGQGKGKSHNGHFLQDHLEWGRAGLQWKMCDYYQKGNTWTKVAYKSTMPGLRWSLYTQVWRTSWHPSRLLRGPFSMTGVHAVPLLTVLNIIPAWQHLTTYELKITYVMQYEHSWTHKNIYFYGAKITLYLNNFFWTGYFSEPDKIWNKQRELGKPLPPLFLLKKK